MDQRTCRNCWTCKARRKKCDGQCPSCETCVRLGIDCEGYALIKPAWHDGGTMQREYCRRLSLIIKGRRKQRNEPPRQHDFDTLNGLGNPLPAHPAGPLFNGPFPLFEPLSNCTLDFRTDCIDTNSSTSLDSALDWAVNIQDVQEFRIPTEPGSSSPQTVTAVTSFSDCLTSLQTQSESDCLQGITNSDYTKSTGWLFMHYFDDTIFDIFPEHCLGYCATLRGCLFSWSTMSATLHNLILSAAKFQSEQRHSIDGEATTTSDVSNSDSWRALHNRAFTIHREEMRKILGVDQSTSTHCYDPSSYLIALTCVVHFIWLSRFLASAENVRHLLQDAIDLLVKIDFFNGAQNRNGPAGVELDSGPGVISFSPYESETLTLMCNMLVSHTILWVSLSPESSERKYLYQLMEQNSICLLSSPGETLQAIKSINNLREWKHNLLQQGTLNVLELGRRGLVIERILSEELHRIQQSTSAGYDWKTRTTRCRRSVTRRLCQFHADQHLVTSRLLTLSAQIYLHVVVSGPNTALPDIQRRVELCEEEFQVLEIPSTYRLDLVWSRCVLESVRQDVRINGNSTTEPSIGDVEEGSIAYLSNIITRMKKAWGIST